MIKKKKQNRKLGIEGASLAYTEKLLETVDALSSDGQKDRRNPCFLLPLRDSEHVCALHVI